MALQKSDLTKLKAIETLARLRRENKLFQFSPYKWQNDFYSAGKDYRFRMIIAGNRVGKTYTAAHEIAFHATGLYPDDWTGVKHTTPILAWCGGITNESLRDISQKEMLGGTGEAYGTGAIPKHLLGKPNMRMAGISGVVDSVKVKHSSGGYSEIVWKSYEQGWMKWQGTAVDYVWLDEDPNDVSLFTEAVTRLMTKKGRMLVTFTPLLGVTPMLQHFYDLGDSVMIKNVTWDDAPHLSESDKQEMLEQYPEHERDTRSKGIPMRGEGVAFPFPEADIKVEPFEIPKFWQQIIGIDFGYDHPAATVKIAIDPDNDVVYVIDANKERKMDALAHSEKVKRMGGGLYSGMLPVAWPHDGLNTEKGKGEQLIASYREHDINLLGKSARYKDDVGGGQSKERSVMEIYERIKTGRFKVFSNLSSWFEEYRNYHRKDNKLSDIMDDILSATFYAYMMRRYAVSSYMLRSRSDNNMPSGAYL